MDPNMNTPPPPPDGSGVVASPVSAAPPPPPDGSGIVAAAPGNPTATMSASNPHSLLHGSAGAIQHTPDESTLSTIGKDAGNVVTGAGRGIFSTLSGFNDMLDKHMPGDRNEIGRATVRDTLHHLAGQGESLDDPAQQVGYGGETLLEFLGGDEALKALSIPDKLAQISQTWKTIENSPRLMQALKLGSSVLKGGAQLSPEELEVVSKYPRLKALLHVGADAARAGTVQGAQTTVRTGGDVGAGATDAALTAATVGAAHGVTGGAAHPLGKGKKAAETIAEMTGRAAEAPTSSAVNNQFKNTVEGAFGKETGTLQNNLDDATSTIQMAGQGAPPQSAITQHAQNTAKASRQQLSNEYVDGLNKLAKHIDPDPENPMSIPYEGSPLHEAAKGLQAEGIVNQGPLDKALQKTRPGSPRANRTIDMLSDLKAGEEGEEGEESGSGAHGLLDDFIQNGETAPEAGGEDGAEPGEEGTPITLKHLTEYRRVLGERMRNLGFTSSDDNADRKIYQRLIKGVDDTIAHMADKAAEPADLAAGAAGGEEEGDFEPEEGDEEAPTTAPGEAGTKARQILDQMNSKYRNGIRPFQNPDVKMLLKGNQNDVVKKLISGGTSIDDINAVRKVIGPNSLKTLGDASIQNMINGAVDDSGDLDHKKLFKQWQKINPDVRKAMFGDTGDALSKALQSASASSHGLDEIGKTMQTLLGNGDVDSAAHDVDRMRKLSTVVGPDGMKTLGQSMLEREIGKASQRLDPKTGLDVKDRFDPDKVLDWWNSFKDVPEVRDMLFHPDAESKQAYADTMKRLGQASSVKKLVKYGLLPATLGTAGLVHGPLAALTAATAGLGAEGFGSARNVLEHIANNPRTWKFLSAVGKVGELGNSKVAKVGSQASYNIMKSASDSMSSGTKPQSGGGDTDTPPKTEGGGGPQSSVSLPNEPIVKSENPEDEPHDISYSRNKDWAKPGPYITKLTPKDEAEFQKWAKANPKLVEGELDTDTPDYDVRGRWLGAKNGDPEAKLTRSEFDGTLHASDKWKTPYDAVFSRESKYALSHAPRWDGDRLVTHDGRLVVDETPKKKGSK